MNRRKFIQLAGTLGSIAVAPFELAAARQSVLPLALPATRSTIAGVPLGCASISFMDAPINKVPALLNEVGYAIVEISSDHLEPVLGTGVWPWASAAEQLWSADDRQKLREWRLNTPLSYFEGIGRMFRDSGIQVYAYNAHFGQSVSDAELERAFEVTRAMGGRVVTSVGPQTNEFSRRLDASAKKSEMRVGIHNTGPMILKDEAAWDSVLMGCSELVGLNLDIGHYAKAGSDPVALIRRKRDLVFDVHLKPKREVDASGQIPPEGDATIHDVLIALRDNHWAIPANLEHEVLKGDRLPAVKRWFVYSRSVLQS